MTCCSHRLRWPHTYFIFLWVCLLRWLQTVTPIGHSSRQQLSQWCLPTGGISKPHTWRVDVVMTPPKGLSYVYYYHMSCLFRTGLASRHSSFVSEKSILLRWPRRWSQLSTTRDANESVGQGNPLLCPSGGLARRKICRRPSPFFLRVNSNCCCLKKPSYLIGKQSPLCISICVCVHTCMCVCVMHTALSYSSSCSNFNPLYPPHRRPHDPLRVFLCHRFLCGCRPDLQL